MNIEEKSINALRILGVDAINKAKSGHPGIVLGAAPIIEALFTKHLNTTATNDSWFNRDRFVLAAGHGSALLYSILHFFGYYDLDDLKELRQLHSKTPGHPEFGSRGIDATSGPLGQGIAMACGMAIAETQLSARYNKEYFDLINHYTYVICGDGDLQEGVTQEAMSLAGHLKLGKLIVLYDSNDIQLDGEVALSNTENVKNKYEAMGWQYLLVSDGNDYVAIDEAIKEAKLCLDKPTIVEIKTIIGYGSPLAGMNKVHGAPLLEEKTVSLRQALGWENEPFDIPVDVYDYFKAAQKRGKEAYEKWNLLFEQYLQAYPKEGQELRDLMYNQYRIDFSLLKRYESGTSLATRNASGEAISQLSILYPTLIGGSADLASSCMAKGADGNYSASNRLGRNINYGVREHAMGAITNGLVLHGGMKAFSGGFFVFSDYMKPAMRMAALMSIPSIFVFSHDSIAVGEDGPTHEPIEQLTGLRSIPNMIVIRPCDANETVNAWCYAMQANLPITIVTTRQKLPVLENVSYEGLVKGGYVMSPEKGELDGCLIACGSEVSLALKVQAELEKEEIYVRVVNMPSSNLFDRASSSYRESVIPKDCKTLAIEMGSSLGWYKYAQNVFGIDTFGASAPMDELINSYGFTVQNIVNVYKNMK